MGIAFARSCPAAGGIPADDNLLARSSRQPVETRVQAWQRLCDTWEIRPWPMTFASLKRVAGSLCLGGYSLVQEYFNAAMWMWYQEQQLGMPIEAVPFTGGH